MLTTKENEDRALFVIRIVLKRKKNQKDVGFLASVFAAIQGPCIAFRNPQTMPVSQHTEDEGPEIRSPKWKTAK